MHKEAIQDPSNVFTGWTNLDKQGGQGARGDEERKSKWLRSTIWRIIEERTDQRNAQINFSLINLLLFKLLRHVSAT